MVLFMSWGHFSSLCFHQLYTKDTGYTVFYSSVIFIKGAPAPTFQSQSRTSCIQNNKKASKIRPVTNFSNTEVVNVIGSKTQNLQQTCDFFDHQNLRWHFDFLLYHFCAPPNFMQVQNNTEVLVMVAPCSVQSGYGFGLAIGLMFFEQVNSNVLP